MSIAEKISFGFYLESFRVNPKSNLFEIVYLCSKLLAYGSLTC
ncbi:hypothetical protein KL86DYS1_10233 [uncultured Dysgonomonas sp.]|uniref:Uncharacterized protein n=1 Tax=uncultured Dysgonomonas sp. TaxID=206096 RepID=A0A212IVV4_9BACT|nr:hypothetical protein KL86DYS1_10233 [uncultured Dysgonomonas sp.]